MLALSLAAISPHISLADDGGGAVVFWVVVGIIWLVSQIASGLRAARAARSRAQAAQPQGTAAAAEATPAARRMTRTHSIRSTARVFPSAASPQQLPDSATAPIPAAQYMAGAPLGRQADDAQRRKVYGDLLAGFGGVAVSPDAPQPPAPPVSAQGTAAIAEAQAPSRGALLANLFGPRGLAFAVVASTIIGPCAGLKREPQEPGGW